MDGMRRWTLISVAAVAWAAGGCASTGDGNGAETGGAGGTGGGAGATVNDHPLHECSDAQCGAWVAMDPGRRPGA